MNGSGTPLQGRRILVTRAQAEAGGLIDRLAVLGAEALLVPLIETEVIASPSEIGACMARLRSHGGARFSVFTSATTVRIVAAAVPDGLADRLAGTVVCAVGPATASALERLEVAPDLIPYRFVAEALAAALIERGVEGGRVWLPAAEGARPVLRRSLVEAGADVESLAVYRSVMPENAAAKLHAVLEDGPIDAVAFTSESTVEHFCTALAGRRFPDGAIAACIGPVTAAAALRSGLPIGVVAPCATSESLAAELAAHYSDTFMEGG